MRAHSTPGAHPSGERAPHLLAALALTALGGCGVDERPPSWGYIHAAILAPSCATVACHSNQNAQAGVKLHSEAAAYAILLGRACGETPAPDDRGNFVVPFEPARSRLVHLLWGEDVRLPMPPDRLLPAADIELIEDWILEGAPCD